jgi:hypothetical protein
VGIGANLRLFLSNASDHLSAKLSDNKTGYIGLSSGDNFLFNPVAYAATPLTARHFVMVDALEGDGIYLPAV